MLSASLLAGFSEFAHIPRRPDVENGAVLQGRMLRHELYRVIHVARLNDAKAAQLFLGFHVRTIGRRGFAVLPTHGQCSFRRLNRFSNGEMSAGAKMVVVFKAFVE